MAATEILERPQQTASEKLFTPIRVGRYNLKHRIVMAPLTRSRARVPGNVPTELNACYYAQRASAARVINPAAAAAEPDPRALRMLDTIRRTYKGILMVCGGFDHETAEDWLEKGKADLIAFGRKFLANPDLPERLRKRAALNPDDPSTYYGGGAKGYTDYPSLAQELGGEQPKPCVDASWR